jgi:hypothetical protein
MLYNILQDFKGSQDGRIVEEFKAGTQADLSDYLVACVGKGWIGPIADEPVAPIIQNKAVVTDGKGGKTRIKSGDKA